MLGMFGSSLFGLVGLVSWIVCAIIGALIAPWKNRTRPEGFFLCLVFGIVGVIGIAIGPAEDEMSYPMRFHEELRDMAPPRHAW